MQTTTPSIKASPSQVDLLVGPLFFAIVIGGAGAFGIGRLFWKADELIDHWEMLAIFAVLFTAVFVLVSYVNARISFWKIENGAVYKGKKLLFYLNDIQAAKEGLPDNWTTTLARLPIKYHGSGGIAYHAFARKKVLVLKLTQGRWFMWSGLVYKNYEQFRDCLLNAAPATLQDIPDTIAPKMKIININRILHD